MKVDSTRIWAKLKRRKFILLVIGIVAAIFTVATGVVEDNVGKILTVIGGLLAILGAYLTFRGHRRNRERELLPLTHPYDAQLPEQASASLNPNQSPSDSDPAEESHPLLSEDRNPTAIPDVNVSSQEETSPRMTASDSQETLVSYPTERSPMLYAMTGNPLRSPNRQIQVFNNALEHLNHWCQSHNRIPKWTSKCTGPPHRSEWESIVQVDGMRGLGQGLQKQESKRIAAAEFLRVVGAA